MPRAISKGDNETSREMVERFAFANGTAVQIHWPSRIEASEGGTLQDWLDMIGRKIIANVAQDTGYYDAAKPSPTAGNIEAPPDLTEAQVQAMARMNREEPGWREQRGRTMEALADKIVIVPPMPPIGSWLDHAITDSTPPPDQPYVHFHIAPNAPVFTAPASELRRYFNGCGCIACGENRAVPGGEYIDAEDPRWGDHMIEVAAVKRDAPPQYFQCCGCGPCKGNRMVEGAVCVMISEKDWLAHKEAVAVTCAHCGLDIGPRFPNRVGCMASPTGKHEPKTEPFF